MSNWFWATLSGRRSLVALSAVAAISISASAVAHHSYSMFDFKAPTTLVGTVREFQWTNPHVFIRLEVSQPKGASKSYMIETQSPSILMRLGWKFTTVRAGDKVTIVMFPLRNGSDGGALYSISLPSNKTLKSTFSESFLKTGKPE